MHQAMLAIIRMAFSLLSLIGFATPTKTCSTDWDCELLGDCVNGECVCDPGWKGDSCGTLNLGPTTVIWPNSAGLKAGQAASWGASVLSAAPSELNGVTHHLFADVVCLKYTCAHTNSAQIIHATSTSGVSGPYTFVETAIPAEVENVHSARAPNGTMLLYYGDHEFVFPNSTCTGGSTTPTVKFDPTNPPYPRRVKRMGIAYKHAGDSSQGPWSQHFPEYDESMKPLLPLVNPSPLILPNGTTLLAFRYIFCCCGCLVHVFI